MALYFYMSDSQDGWRNLARDRFFLNRLQKDDIMLYFYINGNAVIIGKNQNAWKECNLAAMEEDGVQVVRRHTGGGAVFHDKGNLNFSFIMGEQNYDLARQMGVIQKALSKIGLKAELSGRNDILVDGRKFSGNAFGMARGMRAHHGTILVKADLGRLSKYLNVSPKKIQSKGISSVRSRVCNLTEFVPDLTVERMAELLKEGFREEYGEYETYAFSPQEAEEVEKIYREQASWEWRLGRTPKFDFELDERFSFGEMQILFTMKSGAVIGVQVFSDALDTELAGRVQKALLGVRFTAEDLAGALREDGGQELLEIADYIAQYEL